MGWCWQQLLVWILCIWLIYGYYVEVASFDRRCVVFGYFCGCGVVIGFICGCGGREKEIEKKEREREREREKSSLYYFIR